MPRHVHETRDQIVTEIGLKISKDLQVKRGTKEFAERVALHAKLEWDTANEGVQEGPGAPPHTYEHGDYRDSIHAEKRRERFLNKGWWPHWWVGSNHPQAHMLEYGTLPDRPGSRSPWGPNTPTPEFAIFAKTAHHFRGTPD